MAGTNSVSGVKASSIKSFAELSSGDYTTEREVVDGQTVITKRYSNNSAWVVTFDDNGDFVSMTYTDSSGNSYDGADYIGGGINMSQSSMALKVFQAANEGKTEFERKFFQSTIVDSVAALNEGEFNLEAEDLFAASLLLTFLTSSVRELMAATQRDQIEKIEEARKLKAEQVMQDIKDYYKKLRKQKKAAFWVKVVSWVAAATAFIAGAALMATGVGAITGGILMAMAVDTMVSLGTGDKSGMAQLTGVIAGLFRDAGMSKEAANITAGVVVALAVMLLTLGAGSMAAGSAASSTNASLLFAATKVASLTSILSTFTQIAQTGVSMNLSFATYATGEAELDKEKNQLDIILIQDLLDQAMELVKTYLESRRNILTEQAKQLADKSKVDSAITQRILRAV
ncbi:type III secretion system translocon subunit SctE [Thalassomonas viridans]|uniref:Type III secretion system translocon subunit SctE n=1 Tax=Thalassomonas viridans TaxID=137584 RepID=A0AAE9Z8U3_9GAMM|nr:type III secretion system translocon subunit SctE [Thalassomonas viridans]WDE08643.1 type III secretion system translocon subunit SctE [Thalassomonas viridans]